MIVVFDSGVWVSAIRFGGVPRDAIVQASLRGETLICTEIENEVIEVMRRKFSIPESGVRSRMDIFLQNSTRVFLTGTLSGICRDPKDDFILECAEIGEADLIVTGDKDLLSLATFGRIEIVTPRLYLDRHENQRPGA